MVVEKRDLAFNVDTIKSSKQVKNIRQHTRTEKTISIGVYSKTSTELVRTDR